MLYFLWSIKKNASSKVKTSNSFSIYQLCLAVHNSLMNEGWQASEMYSCNHQNAFIMFLKNTESIAEALHSVKEHETNLWLILKEVYGHVFSLDIPFGDFSHNSTLF